MSHYGPENSRTRIIKIAAAGTALVGATVGGLKLASDYANGQQQEAYNNSVTQAAVRAEAAANATASAQPPVLPTSTEVILERPTEKTKNVSGGVAAQAPTIEASATPSLTATSTPTPTETATAQFTQTPEFTATPEAVTVPYNVEQPVLRNRVVGASVQAVVENYHYEIQDGQTEDTLPLLRQYSPLNAERPFHTRQSRANDAEFEQGDQIHLNLRTVYGNEALSAQLVAFDQLVNNSIVQLSAEEPQYALNAQVETLLPNLESGVVQTFDTIYAEHVAQDAEEARYGWLLANTGLAARANTVLGFGLNSSEVIQVGKNLTNMLANERYETQEDVQDKTDDLLVQDPQTKNLTAISEVPAFDAYTRQIDMNPSTTNQRADQEFGTRCVALELVDGASVFGHNIDINSIFDTTLALYLPDLAKALPVLPTGQKYSVEQVTNAIWENSTALPLRSTDPEGLIVPSNYAVVDQFGNPISAETMSHAVVIERDCEPAPGELPTTEPTDTEEPEESATPTATRTPGSSTTPTATATNTPVISLTPSNTASPTKSPTPSLTPSLTLTGSQTATNTPTPTRTPSATFTSSPSATFTPSRTPSATMTPSATRTPSATFTATRTPSMTPSRTPTATETWTLTPSYTPTERPTATPTGVPSNVPPATQTPNPTSEVTSTWIPSPTKTAVPDESNPTPAPGEEATPVPQPTNTPSF